MHCVCATLGLPAWHLKPFYEQGFDNKQLFNQKASRLSLSEQSSIKKIYLIFRDYRQQFGVIQRYSSPSALGWCGGHTHTGSIGVWSGPVPQNIMFKEKDVFCLA